MASLPRSHTPLTTQTNEAIIAELGWSKKVIKDAIGVTPKFMRPPYGDIECAVLSLDAGRRELTRRAVTACAPSRLPWALRR